MKKKRLSKKAVVVRKKKKVARQKKVLPANPISQQEPVVGEDATVQPGQVRIEGEIGSTQPEKEG